MTTCLDCYGPELRCGSCDSNHLRCYECTPFGDTACDFTSGWDAEADGPYLDGSTPASLIAFRRLVRELGDNDVLPLAAFRGTLYGVAYGSLLWALVAIVGLGVWMLVR